MARSLAGAHKRLLADHQIQFVFDSAPTPPTPRPLPGWLRALGHLFQALGPFLQILFWVGVAAVVVLIVFLVVRELGWIRLGRDRNDKPAEFSYQPDAATAHALLADADALAAQGRFAEAVHVLLQRSVDDLRRLRPRAIGPAYTSREIAILPALPERVRPAFAAMADLVERSLFGGRPVAQADFRSARTSYEQFAFAGAWS